MRVRFLADGRIGWPEVVEYELLDRLDPKIGEVYPLEKALELIALRIARPSQLFNYQLTGRTVLAPSHDGTAFLPRVRDKVEYERLERAGWISSQAHQGKHGLLQDNRRTS